MVGKKNKTNKQQQKTHRHKVVGVMLTLGVVRVLGAGPIIQILVITGPNFIKLAWVVHLGILMELYTDYKTEPKTLIQMLDEAKNFETGVI